MVSLRKVVGEWLVAVVLAALVPVTAGAEFYEYVDRNGTVHFVDDESKIPKQYRGKKRVDDEGGAPTGSRSLPVTIVGNQVLVPVTINYLGRETQALLLLDTGASVTTIYTDVAERLGIEYRQTGRASVHVVGGGVLDARHVKLSHMAVGRHTKYNVDAVIVEHNGRAVRYEGLLGMNFLRDIRYNVDFDNQVINWGP